MNRGVSIQGWGRLLLAVPFALAVASLTIAGAEEERKPWVAPRRHGRKKNPVKADAASIERGRQLFLQHCLSCHGTSGAGDGPAASGLDVHPGDLTNGEKLGKESDGSLFFKIRTGRRPMTAFRDTLKKKEIWDVVNYVRTLSSGKAAARTTWFKGPAPKLSDDLRREVVAVAAASLDRYAKLREAVRAGDGKAIAAEAAAVGKELARLDALKEGDSFRGEVDAFKKLVLPHLDGIGKADEDARPKHLSEVSSRLGELVGRYAPELPEPWTLYLYDAKGKQGSLYWLQRAGEPANPFAPGASAVAAATFGQAK